MNVKQHRRAGCQRRWNRWHGRIALAGLVLMTAGTLCAQSNKKPPGGDKPGGDQAEWLKKLDEMASRTPESQKNAPPPSGTPAAPAPASAPAQPPVSPVSAPTAPGTGLRPPSQAPAPLPQMQTQVQGQGQGQAAEPAELFEDDFDRTAVVSYAHRRVVLLVFAPQAETDAWRTTQDLLPWAQRVVICPVHEGAQGDRAQRLATAFGMDPTKGGMLTALVRAPDNLLSVTGDQLLYQVLGRYPAPADAADVVRAMQEGVAAYEIKKGQYIWDAMLPPGVAPPPLAPPAPPQGGGASPAPSAPLQGAMSPPAPAAPAASAFEKVAMNAWNGRKPIVLIFPGNEPFDKAALAEAWRVVPEVLAPELLVLTPGSADGSIGGKAVNWEEFFDVGGRYPHAVMVLPEHDGGVVAPKVADMSYRVIARQHGDFVPQSVPLLARKWMFEDYDSVMMRAWVLGKPMLLVFPHPDAEADLLNNPALAGLEARVAVFVNLKGSVSGIRRKTSAQLDKEFASEGVERAELVLLKLTTKQEDLSSVRLDQIELKPVNRALAKKTPEKILEWVSSRVPAKSASASAGN